MKLMKRLAFFGLLLPLCLAASCAQREEDRQPSAAEVREYIARIDRQEAGRVEVITSVSPRRWQWSSSPAMSPR